MKILLVCLGNICRSPMAEGILRHGVDAAAKS
jgi:protein-tyrosine phosphatase